MSGVNNLSNQYISASFQPLMQYSSSGYMFDGFGNPISSVSANSFTGSLSGVAATASYSFASALATTAQTSTTASYALTASYVANIISSSYATTASYALNANAGNTTQYITRLSASYSSSGATANQVVGLSLSPPIGTYKFKACLFIKADATGGLSAVMSGTCTAVSTSYNIMMVDNTTKATVISDYHTDLLATSSYIGATKGLLVMEGTTIFQTITSFGPFFAQSISNNTSAILTGSYFEMTKIN